MVGVITLVAPGAIICAYSLGVCPHVTGPVLFKQSIEWFCKKCEVRLKWIQSYSSLPDLPTESEYEPRKVS